MIIGTGLSGLVGSRIVELLGHKYDFTDFSLKSGIDILKPDTFPVPPSDSSVLIHLAAFTDTTTAWDQRGDTSGLCYRLNVTGTQNILDYCKKYHKYLIYISTDFVFDGANSGSYTEDDTPHPIEWYGQTKYLGEKLVLTSGLPAAIIRIAFPYRAHFDPKPDLVRKMIAKFQANQTLSLFTDQITTPTFIDDIALGLDYFFGHQPSGIFHLVGSSSQSPFDLGCLVADTFGFDKNLVQPSSLASYLSSQPSPRPYQKNLSLSNQKVKNLGILPKDIKHGLLDMKTQIGR